MHDKHKYVRLLTCITDLINVMLPVYAVPSLIDGNHMDSRENNKQHLVVLFFIPILSLSCQNQVELS